MTRSMQSTAVAVAALLCLAILDGCGRSKPQPGEVQDEARTVGRTPESFPAADEAYFKDMDNAVALTGVEEQGRNTWLVWTGGNDRLWNDMTAFTYGAFDLLKIVSSYPGQRLNRDTRWTYLGAINEPCFDTPTSASADRFGLWLDVRRADCGADPFENEQKYPGVVIGARGKDGLPVGSFYGYASGIVGLRLFPNPDFDEKARKNWDPERFYTDPSYYNRKDLVRPYRVGMSCGFCHVGPSPLHPPADPEHPQWSELSSTVGAQYLWLDRLFITEARKDNYMFQLLHTYRPGTMDTSLVSTDNINNPRTMNAVYNVMARMEQARRWGQETLKDGELDNKQLNEYVPPGTPLAQFFEAPDKVWTPHVLKDGADSVGILGALNRVYINIGLFSEEWLLHFNPVVGGKTVSPIRIKDAEKNSAYWQATELQTPATALFFLKAARPDKLAEAPGGADYLTEGAPVVNRGKVVFAETCARCHSSKAPTPPAGADLAGCAGPGYLDCWNKYWAWTKTDEFKQQMRVIVGAPDFLDGNFLSTEARVPITLLQTNACSPLATNAIGDNIWDNFSSQSYKSLPAVGPVTIYNPFTGEPESVPMPAGGRGYTRPPSLVSVWSTAPFFLNNSLGESAYEQDPSVAARMRVFQASIEQLLWPEKRDRDPVLGDRIPGKIDRTDTRSTVTIPVGYLPEGFQELSGGMRARLNRWFPWVVSEGGDLTIGPIPSGTPVSLLSNLQPRSESSDPLEKGKHVVQVVDLLVNLKKTLADLPTTATDEEIRQAFADAGGKLWKLSKCRDYVVNRGHYFGTQLGPEPSLPDADKRALIAFIKTF